MEPPIFEGTARFLERGAVLRNDGTTNAQFSDLTGRDHTPRLVDTLMTYLSSTRPPPPADSATPVVSVLPQTPTTSEVAPLIRRCSSAPTEPPASSRRVHTSVAMKPESFQISAKPGKTSM